MLRVKEISYPNGYKEIIINDMIINKKNNKNGGRKKGKLNADDENIKRKIYRVKRDIRRLALLNGLTRMMTLTFRDNIENVDIADKVFKKFIYELRNRGYRKLRYIMVRERQKRGAIHYHVLISHFIKHKIVYKLWNDICGGGGVNLKHTGLKGINYTIKYIEKDIEENIFISGRGYAKKCYTTSNNLRRNFESITKEYFAFVKKSRDGKLDGLMGIEVEKMVKEVNEAILMGRLIYMSQGSFGENKEFSYRCILIAPCIG